MAASTDNTTTKTLQRIRSFRYVLVLEGIAVGVFAGIIVVLFRIALEKADGLLHAALAFGRANPWFIPLWFGLLLAMAAAVTLLVRYEPMIGGSGIPQVEGEMQGRIQQCWWRVLAAKFAGGVLSIGAGLSLGREGPSIQLGAMAGKGFARVTRRVKTEEKLLLTCGASAGLSAAFNAPFAGVLFSLEEVHKNFSAEVLLSTMASSITADFISRNIFGLKPVFDFHIKSMMPLQHYGLVIVLGLILGLLGAVYILCIEKSQQLYDRVRPAYCKTVIPFVLAGILGFTWPALLGGGHSLVEQLSGGDMALGLLGGLFAAKFLFSMLSFGAGVPGGIFLPLLVLGAVVGGAFSVSATSLFGVSADLLQNFMILGMAGYFSVIVRAPITGVILISEMTGSFSHMLTLSIVSLTAYLVADLLRVKPVYDQLLCRLLSRQGGPSDAQPTGEKVLLESPVCHGAAAEDKKISEIRWPRYCLVVSLLRGENEIVPNGETVIRAGDTIAVLCDETVSHLVHETLENACGRVVKPVHERRDSHRNG